MQVVTKEQRGTRRKNHVHFCITVGNECATEWNGNVKEGMIEICKEVNSASKYTEIWGGGMGWDQRIFHCGRK